MLETSLDSSVKSKGRPLRVLFVGFSYVIDVYQRKLTVVSEIGNVEIGVLAPQNWKMREWDKTFVLKTHYPGIRIFPAPVLFNGIQGAYLYPVTSLLRAILTFKPDILQVEQEVFSLVTFELALAARIFKIPMVVFCWENMDKNFSFIRRFTRKFVLDSASVINPGGEEAAKLMRKWGYKGTIKVMPLFGVDTALFHPYVESDNDGIFSIGYVGRLVKEKGVDLIFLAAKDLVDRGYEFRVLICGTGPEEESLRQLANQLKLDDKIIWLGSYPYKEIPLVISRMNVLVLPSRTVPGKWKEQFGHVLIEAMAMGIPVIGSDSGAIPDVIGRADLIFREDDATGLAGILEKMIYSRTWREQVIQYGMDRVLKEFSHEVIANKMFELWESVIR